MAKTPLDQFVDTLLAEESDMPEVPKQQTSSPLKARYHQTAESLLSDCEAIDANWLAEAYPALWRRMQMIDLQLTRLERRNAEPEEYNAMLDKLIATVKQARILHETERLQQEAVRQ